MRIVKQTLFQWLKIEQIALRSVAMMALALTIGFTIVSSFGYYFHDLWFNREVDSDYEDESTSTATVVPTPSVPVPLPLPTAFIDLGGAWDLVDDTDNSDVD